MRVAVLLAVTVAALSCARRPGRPTAKPYNYAAELACVADGGLWWDTQEDCLAAKSRRGESHQPKEVRLLP